MRLTFGIGRIHLKLHYPDLDESKRHHIWKMFLSGHSELFDVTDSDLVELAKRPLNGREVCQLLSHHSF